MGSVPYRGGAPALNDLIGGHIPLSVKHAGPEGEGANSTPVPYARWA